MTNMTLSLSFSQIERFRFRRYTLTWWVSRGF